MSPSPIIRDIALEFLGRGGKQLRPRLCRGVFESLAPAGTPVPAVPAIGDVPAAVADPGARGLGAFYSAVECFHKASLIHDDIQDGDETRYGRPTVWREHGVAVAIAAGDWLVARGYELIACSGCANAAAMLAETAASHVRLCEGQGDELLGGESVLPSAADTSRYVSVCRRKTGEAFALAAALGALAAGFDPSPWREWGLVFGVLFQVRDDIADIGESDALCALRTEYEKRLSALPAVKGFPK